MVKIEEGKLYRDRRGIVQGPMRRGLRTDSIYIWWEPNSIKTYTADGRYNHARETENDLIEEVLPPSASEGAAMKGSDTTGTGEGAAPTIRGAVLAEASSIVNGPRAQVYGGPEDNFARIARLWTAHGRNTGRLAEGRSFDPVDVALMLDLVKTARLAQSPDHWDSWVDKAGYSACGAECAGAKSNV